MVNEWRKKSENRTTSNKTNTPGNKKRKFYKSTRSDVIQKLTEAKKRISPSELPAIMLTLKESNLPHLRSEVMEPVAKSCTKTSKENSERNGQPRKKLKTCGDVINSFNVGIEEDLEDDLFKEYLNFSNKCKPIKKHGSLLESLDCVT